MFRANFSVQLALVALALSLFPYLSTAQGNNKPCVPSSCGNLSISYPFRLTSDPIECGYPGYELVCENNSSTFLIQEEKSKFLVKEISYEMYTIRLVDASLNVHTNTCSIPHNSLLFVDKACGGMYILEKYSIMYALNCNTRMNSSNYVDASVCSNSTSYFFMFTQQSRVSDFDESCRIEAQFPFLASNITALSAYDVYNKLLLGFELSWQYYNQTCEVTVTIPTSLGQSILILLPFVKNALITYLDSLSYFFLRHHIVSNPGYSTRTYILCVGITGGVVLPRAILGISILLTIIIRRFRRRHFSADDTIEEFLLKQNNFMPIRYSYAEIKKITEGFKKKLGQGGYGSVFKGKLRSGDFVAVKLLSKVKGNGQDFINEVATIGRIHHANVMRLVGFCVEGSNQALVYDFMPNGSLDKVIFSEGDVSLSWEKMFDIALGVARGIDYLHRGCEMQILHFDIKPHNILLDENFNPKVSDFGLAKLYPTDQSVVLLTAARGTRGYIAPELVYQNIGGISYKADVYSYGMMLMEMVGKRRSLRPFSDESSQVFFPTWVYDRVDQGEDIELGDVTDAEKNAVRKLIIVALWCIHMKPVVRPSMSKVLEMLDSKVDLLEMPPKPCLFPHTLPTPTADEGSISLAAPPTMSLDAR